MPPCQASVMLQWFDELGRCDFVPMGGAAPIKFTEITAWADGNAIALSPWQFSTLRQMSLAYASEYNAAKDPLQPQPYLTREAVEANRQAIAQSIEQSLNRRRR